MCGKKCPSTCDCAGHCGEAAPFFTEGERVAVGKEFAFDPFGSGAQRNATEEEERVLRAGGLGEHASGSGAEREFLPTGVEISEVDGESARGGCGGVRAFGAAGDDDLAADERAGRIGERAGEEREGADLEFAFFDRQRVAISVMAMRVSAADHQEPLADRDTDAVAARAGQFAEARPLLGAGAGEGEDFVMPDLNAAVPSWFVGKVGAATAKEQVAGGAHKGAAEAGGVGSFRKSGPAHGNRYKEDRPHKGVQRLGGRGANVVAPRRQSVLFA